MIDLFITMQVCSIVSGQSPRISYYDDMETVLKNNPEVKVQGELRVSPDCTTGKVSDVDVSFFFYFYLF